MLPATIPILDTLSAKAGAEGFGLVTDIGSYTSRVVSLVLIVAALGSFIYLVYGGLQWITAGGDKTKVDEARARLTNAVLGLAIVAAAWAIFKLVNYFFGLNIVS